ncbi:Fe-S cluster assembly protein SufD [Halobacteriovorax sp. GB3]|uniref:Fe-S cluster assembly protein SufD n=1 Tax=Halobacteriovorax sp. GB3 TaxID=2719615 RepID=UPI002360CCF6|nr:Fe-S cluster assembly protein SufD [Halobacteriovorax sp. GB3]MDD0852271.1 Fe-S cluster assembly protein SufD [Halobacteriovorax sp. GB3]
MTINELTSKYTEKLKELAVSDFQKNALSNFQARGLPHTKMEDWLYTKLTDVLPENFDKVSKKGILKNVKLAGKYQIVFLNGAYSKEDSFLPDEVEATLISATELSEKNFIDDKNDIFAMLNASANDQILSIKVSKNAQVDDNINIVHLSDFQESFAMPRTHIEVESFAKVNFVEIFKGNDELSYNQAAVTNFNINDGAIVTHIKVQTEGLNSFHVSSVNADVKRDALFKTFTFNTGALKARHNIKVALLAEGANCSVDGLYAISENQHCDNFSLIDHRMPHTESSQLFKGVLDDKARGVFTGKVLVQKDAQKVNSEQLNKNLLLSKKAHADTRPQLEVYADDVKCAHGATVGQLSDEEAFYLQSRGLSRERVQKLLIHAFCSDAISKLEDDKLENFLSEVLFESFEKKTFEHLDEVKDS